MSLFGVVNVYKPQGPTSHDVVAKLRKVYGLKKVGHMGSLDPLAEGVLPVCIGPATRLIEYFPTDKSYRATLTFGKTTTTLDAEGEVVSETPCRELTVAQVEEVAQQFLGTVVQVVPLHSAVHVQGKKLYEYAHKGEEVPQKLPSREVTFYEVTVESFQPASDDAPNPVAVIKVACSSGTYIRALARDMGEKLGCGAYLSRLVRLTHGKFQVEDTVALEELTASEQPLQYLQNPLAYMNIQGLPLTTYKRAQLIAQGMSIPVIAADGRFRGNALLIATYQDHWLAVVRHVGGQFKPEKVFMTPDVLTQTVPSPV